MKQLFGGFSLTIFSPCAKNIIVLCSKNMSTKKEFFEKGDSDIGDSVWH